MYKEILFDHTSLHVFRPEENLSGQALRFRTREMLHFLDSFLLSDVMWLCDTVTNRTMKISQSVIDKLAEHGLTNARSDGKVRLTRFTNSQIEKCCSECARTSYDALAAMDESILTNHSQASHYSVRPGGAQPLTFPDVTRIPFGSEQSQEFVSKAMSSRGWGPMSTVPLMNPDLYQWLLDFVALHPNPEDPAYSRLNTVMRWKFNEILADELSTLGKTQHLVNYAPALGRAITIKGVSSHYWLSKYIDVEKALSKGRVDEQWETAHKFLSEIQTNRKISLPLLGIWVLSGLEENCTIDDLFESLARANTDTNIVSLRRWLAKASDEEISRASQGIANDLSKILRKSRRNKSRVSQTAQHEMAFPIVPFFSNLKIIHKFDMATTTLREKQDFLCSFWPALRARTVVSGLVSDTFQRQVQEADLSKRTASIIKSMSN